MKTLLIVGAGGHGRVVKEIAEDCGYRKIDFLDDNSDVAVGKISEMSKFILEYTDLFVGIGNNRLRGELIAKAEKIGYNIPILIHPTAYISRTAVIHRGTVVEPKAIVNTGTVVGVGVIISAGAVVDHDVVLNNCVHINAGAIVKAGGKVDSYQKIEAG